MLAFLLMFVTWAEVMETGNTALEKGNLSEAAVQFQSALKIASAPAERAAALNNLAGIEEERGNLSRAERFYSQCIEEWSRTDAPADALAKPLNNLALLYRRRGQYEKAAELYGRSLALRPGNAVVLNNMGRMYFVQRKYREAEDFFLRALAARPDYPAALVNLAELQIAVGRFDSARRAAIRVAEDESGRPLEVIARLVLAAADREERAWKQAEGHLLRAVKVAEATLGDAHALSAWAYAEYAFVARKLKRKEEAREYEERARAAVRSSRDRHTISLAELAEDQRR